MSNRTLHSLLIIILTAAALHGQYRQYGIAFSYGVEQPYAKLADRYGSYSSVGLGLEYLLPSKLGISLEWRTYFGDNIKKDVLSSLRGPTGDIIGIDGQAADYYYGIAGDHIMLSLRKILGKNPSGWVVGGGLGLVAQKIRIADINNALVQSVKPYAQLYDELTRGLATKQVLGYEIHSDNKLINGSIVIEHNLNLTKYVRKLKSQSTALLMDNSVALRARWIVPFRTTGEKEKEKVKYY